MIQTAMIAGSILTVSGARDGTPRVYGYTAQLCCRCVWLERGSVRGAACASRWGRRGWRGGRDDLRASVCSSAICSGVIVTVNPFTRLSVVFQEWQVAAAECAAHAASDMSPKVRYLPGTL
jgi:hypothetical protein